MPYILSDILSVVPFQNQMSKGTEIYRLVPTKPEETGARRELDLNQKNTGSF